MAVPLQGGDGLLASSSRPSSFLSVSLRPGWASPGHVSSRPRPPSGWLGGQLHWALGGHLLYLQGLGLGGLGVLSLGGGNQGLQGGVARVLGAGRAEGGL